MNLIFRLLAVLWGAWRRPPLKVADVSILHSRVWPLDLDFNLHMTNSRYMALMDLGRTDLMLRAGLWRGMWNGRLQVVLAGSALRFRRPLAPFARFTLASRLLGWDERWLYVEQVFTGPEGVSCTAVMRAAFLKAGRITPPGPVLAAALPGLAPMPPPDWVAGWAAAEAAFAG